MTLFQTNYRQRVLSKLNSMSNYSIPHNLWKPKVHHRVNKSPALIHTESAKSSPHFPKMLLHCPSIYAEEFLVFQPKFCTDFSSQYSILNCWYFTSKFLTIFEFAVVVIWGTRSVLVLLTRPMKTRHSRTISVTPLLVCRFTTVFGRRKTGGKEETKWKRKVNQQIPKMVGRK
jgi:hypothetical protein